MKIKNSLNDEITINKRVLKNRIVMPAMGTGLASVNGSVTRELIDYYQKRAAGGVGTIIVEIACVDSPAGRASLTQLRIDGPEYIAGLKELSEVIQGYGCIALVQLHHAGRQTTPGVTGRKPLAPSPIACRFMKAEPEEMTIEDIVRVKKKFIKAAYYAQMAGFDGVELHAAHGYLLSQFLSPYTNKRTDEYGGSLENRTRLLVEIVSEIKKNLPAMILSVRVNVADFVPGGIEIEEGIKIARIIEEAGADVLNVSCGIYESGQTSIETSSFAEGWRMDMVAQVKENVAVPVIGGGVIRDPDFAEKLIRDGKTDLIWLGRPLLADPFWVEKVLNGQQDIIRPCITCDRCINQINNAMHIRCTVNPETGRESLLRNKPKLQGIKALIAGGGPAGMEAALSLHGAGAAVVLIEKSAQWGGQLNIADKAPGKEKVGNFREYLVRRIKSAGIDVRLQTVLTEELINQIQPDILVMAMGASLVIPDIPGINTAPMLAMQDILTKKVFPENEHLVIIGGGTTGCELADFLADNNQVTLLEKTAILAADLENMHRLELLARLKSKGVMIKRNCQVEMIDGPSIKIYDIKNDAVDILTADHIIFAAGYQSNYVNISGHNLKKVFVIGDGKKPRSIMEAVYEARMVAYRVEELTNYR